MVFHLDLEKWKGLTKSGGDYKVWVKLLAVSKMNLAVLTVLAPKHVQCNIRAMMSISRGFYLAKELENLNSKINSGLQSFMSGSVEHLCLRGLRRELVDSAHFTKKGPAQVLGNGSDRACHRCPGVVWAAGACSVSNRTCRKKKENRIYTINSKKRLRSNHG